METGDSADTPADNNENNNESGVEADTDAAADPTLAFPEGLREKPTGTLPAGPVTDLVVDDLIVGDGAVAEAGSTVKVNYVGQLACTGTEFDSSWNLNIPLDFTLGVQQVIYGWDAGVVGMAVGGRRQLTIPYWMAYGDRGTSTGTIGPKADLVFVVDLLEVSDSGQDPIDVETPVEPAPDEVNPLKPIPTLPDGRVTQLEILDIVEGTGPEATAGTLVDVDYVGVLACNGREFDASYNVGQSFPFALGNGQVIPGWDQGVEGMRVGGQRQLTIPSNLAYGDAGSGPIPPNADLVFVVELHSVTEPVSPEDQPEPVRPDSASGELEVLDLQDGTGATLTSGDIVLAHLYAEAFSTGEVFTSTWAEGSLPIRIGVDQTTLPGLAEGLVGMKEGGVRQLVIPPDLAFGAEGNEGVGPDETIIVIVELLQIQ